MHYVLDEDYVTKHFPRVLIFPKEIVGKVNTHACEKYENFRQSWVLFPRTYPVVLCPVQTPLPSAKHNKEHRAKLLSLYWRPWTLHRRYATSDVPHLKDLDVLPDGTERSFRGAWKVYRKNAMPTVLEELKSFMQACVAEGRNPGENEYLDERMKIKPVLLDVQPTEIAQNLKLSLIHI